MTNKKEHSFLAPSASARWINCPASVVLEGLGHPLEESGGAAKEGTLAHSLAEYKLRKNIRGELGIDEQIKALTQDPLYQFEMEVFTSEYLDFIESRTTNDSVVKIEECLDLGAIQDNMIGTVDCAIINEGKLLIVDFKYGKNVEVSAEDNPQLKIYALGILERYKMPSIEKVELVIYQPRMANISSWTTTVTDLIRWKEEVLAPAVERIEYKSMLENPGDWCRFCKGQAVCREYAGKYLKAAPEEFTDPEILSNDEIGELIDKLSGIDSYLKKLKAFAQETLLYGGQIQGYKLVAGRRTRSWSDQALVMARADAESVDLEKTVAIPTPAQLEKQIGKKDFALKFSDLVNQKEGNPTLAKSTDKRKEYKKETA